MFENIFQVEAELGEFARFCLEFFIFQVTMNLIRHRLFILRVYIYINTIYMLVLYYVIQML